MKHEAKVRVGLVIPAVSKARYVLIVEVSLLWIPILFVLDHNTQHTRTQRAKLQGIMSMCELKHVVVILCVAQHLAVGIEAASSFQHPPAGSTCLPFR